MNYWIWLAYTRQLHVCVPIFLINLKCSLKFTWMPILCVVEPRWYQLWFNSITPDRPRFYSREIVNLEVMMYRTASKNYIDPLFPPSYLISFPSMPILLLLSIQTDSYFFFTSSSALVASHVLNTAIGGGHHFPLGGLSVCRCTSTITKA